MSDPRGLGEAIRDAADVFSYARGLQEELRRLHGDSLEEWQGFVDRGLSEAYQQRDAMGLVAILKVVVSLLDVTGRPGAAVTQISHVLNIVRDDLNAVPVLTAFRGCYLAIQGQTAEALLEAEAAEGALPQVTLPEAVSETQCHTAAIHLFALSSDIPLQAVDQLVHPSGEGPLDGNSLFLSSYHIPFLYACGQHTEAEPRQRALRLAARAANHEYRLADAAVFDAAQRSIDEPTEAAPLDSIPRWNWLARWRLQLLRFRAAHLRGDLANAEAELEALTQVRDSAGGADLDPANAFRTYHEVQSDPGGSIVQLEPPKTAHLLNLPSILAGAEAVALGGSQLLANRWRTWLGEQLPPYIETSLEWPVSRARVEALLDLRGAELRSAAELFERAIAWAGQADYPCELAIAGIQAAELHLHHVSDPSRIRAELQTQRRQGWEDLHSRGIEPARYAYHVARLSTWTKDQLLHTRLTPRELEVLALLAEGLTYKQIGERIGVKWRTVQVLAHRCYEKLGASGKVAAVLTARDQGIL